MSSQELTKSIFDAVDFFFKRESSHLQRIAQIGEPTSGGREYAKLSFEKRQADAEVVKCETYREDSHSARPYYREIVWRTVSSVNCTLSVSNGVLAVLDEEMYKVVYAKFRRSNSSYNVHNQERRWGGVVLDLGQYPTQATAPLDSVITTCLNELGEAGWEVVGVENVNMIVNTVVSSAAGQYVQRDAEWKNRTYTLMRHMRG